MCDAYAAAQLIKGGGRKLGYNDQTIRYVVGIAALTILGVVCVVVDGDVGNALGVAVAGAIGYLVKDWRAAKVMEDAKEVQE